MSILDIFKNKETLTSEEIKNLEKEITSLQARHTAEKDSLINNYESVKSVWEQEKTKLAAEGETLKLEKEKHQLEKLHEKKEQAIANHLTNDGVNPKLLKLFKKEIDINTVELSEDTNSITNWDSLADGVKKEFSDFFGAAEIKGVETVNPIAKKIEEKDPFLDGFNDNK